MIDALTYAARDLIRASGYGYGIAECEITDDGRPPPRAGNFFAAIHGGRARATSVRNLDEAFGFSVTLTMRVVVPLDRLGDQQMYRNLVLELARKQGFNAKVEQLRALLHMNWPMTVMTGRTPPSANDNITAWATGTVYGFVTPAAYNPGESARLVGGEWFGAEPEAADVGVAQELRFDGARRMQPKHSVTGAYV